MLPVSCGGQRGAGLRGGGCFIDIMNELNLESQSRRLNPPVCVNVCVYVSYIMYVYVCV